MLKWKRQWLDTHQMVKEYLEKEELDPVGLGLPFNWIMDMISTIEKHLRKEQETENRKKAEANDLKIKISRIKEELKEKDKEKLLGELAGYPYPEGEDWVHYMKGEE